MFFIVDFCFKCVILFLNKLTVKNNKIMYQISAFRSTETKNTFNVWTRERDDDKNIVKQDMNFENLEKYLSGFEIQSVKIHFLSSYLLLDKEINMVFYLFEGRNIKMEQKVDDPNILDKMISEHIKNFAQGEGFYLIIYAK